MIYQLPCLPVPSGKHQRPSAADPSVFIHEPVSDPGTIHDLLHGSNHCGGQVGHTSGKKEYVSLLRLLPDKI